MRLGQRGMPELAVEHRLELHVAARNGVADHDEIDAAVRCVGAVALERPDSFGRQKVAHRRVDVLVGPVHAVASMLEQRRQRRHRRSANPNQMNVRVIRTAASSMTSAGCGRVTTRASTPNGSVQVGPAV